MKKILLLALLMVASLTGWAYDVEEDGIYYNVVSETKLAEVASGDARYTGSVEIPASIVVEGEEYAVCSIGERAFYGCYEMTSVTIPSSVTSIGNNAFEYCRGLSSMTIPSSITSIGTWAFENCDGLTSVHINDLEAWCKIEFGNSYANPLFYAHKLYLGGELIKDLVIPNSVTSIGGSAFYGCYDLTSVTISNSVTSIGLCAFYDCTGLTSVTIPSSVTSIGELAFHNCSGLTSVTIPNSVTSIGGMAFRDCSGLTSVTIPNSVTSIGWSAFQGCRNLKEVYCYAEKVPVTSSDVFRDAYVKYATLYVPEGTVEAYKNADPWKEFGTIKPIILREKLLEDLTKLYNEYKDLTFVTGTEIGNYGKAEVKAFYTQRAEVSIILLDDSFYTDDEIQEAMDNLKATYQAVLDSEVKGPILTDGTEYTNAGEQMVSNLTYTRNFKNTSWQPLYVPFSMSPSDWEPQGLEVARINGFYEYDDDENGTVDRSALEILKVKSGRLKPNHPYLIRAKSTGAVTIKLHDATLYPAEENSGYCCTFETGYTFTGTYSGATKEALTAKGAYIMSSGSLKPSASTLNPMRWYMVRESLGGQLLPELTEIKIYVRGEEETDALDFVNAESTHGETYNLMGQKVNAKTTKGIVIKNGKRVIVK